MVVGRAVARLSIGGADTVAVLRDLEGGPVELRQTSDQPGYDAGLTHAAGMSTDNHQGHRILGLKSRLQPRPAGALSNADATTATDRDTGAPCSQWPASGLACCSPRRVLRPRSSPV